MQSINPYTLEVIAEYKPDSDKEVQRKLQLAQKVFETYRFSPFKERKEKMLAVAKNLIKHRKKYAVVMTQEMGKPFAQSVAEIEKCASVCEYYAENAEKILKKEKIASGAMLSYVSYEPLGVILAVMPWNYPLWQVFRFAAPAIMAGNCGVLKHASNVQGSAQLIEKIFLDGGFEPGTFQNLAIGASKVEAVLRNPIIKGAAVTGSEPAGMAVARVCGEEIKPTVLELGGSNAFIVLNDANIKKSAKIGVLGRMVNNAQSCIAAKRFILQKEIAEDFIEAFRKELEKLPVGDPMDKKTYVGPLARVDLAQDLEDQLKRSLAQGAKLVCGGKRKDAFFEPTILKNVKPGMVAFDEELFGPIASMIVAEDEDHAIELANGTPFGLGATICTRDTKHAEKLARRIDDGAVFINERVQSDPALPFGGTKRSGYGRELSKLGILEFVNAKTVYVQEG